MGASDLRVSVEQPKLRCVVDPALALGHAAGPRVVLGLARVFETWLTRSFWQLIDASELMRGHGPDATALCEWISLRDRTDAASWVLRWVGDNLSESQLKADGGGDDLLDRYEWLSAALQERQPLADGEWRHGFDPVASACDTLALSAALEGALILSPRAAGNAMPWAVQALRRLRLTVDEAGSDPIDLFAAERQVVRHALVGAGLATVLRQLPPLAVVHALVMPEEHGSESDDHDPWTRARAWWYTL
jgi:hypothetical protein